jgi:hypothetical protein
MGTQATSSLARSVLALLAAAIAAATDGAYFALIHAQGGTPTNGGVVPFVAAYIGAIAIAAFLGALFNLAHRDRAAQTSLVAGAVASGGMAFVGIFSIGLGLLVAACLLAIAAVGISPPHRPPGAWVPVFLAAVTALCVLVAGFAITGAFWGR